MKYLVLSDITPNRATVREIISNEGDANRIAYDNEMVISVPLGAEITRGERVRTAELAELAGIG